MILEYIQNLDLQILYFIQNYLSNPIMDKVMVFITDLGKTGFIWILFSIILIVKKKYRKIGLLTLFALLLVTILGEGIMKNIFERSRPYTFDETIKLIVSAPTSFSFPSGHTGSSFAAATVLASEFKNKKYIVWGVYGLAALIAFSRLYLFVHNPSDIIIGALLGICCGKVIIYFGKKKII